jgi:hypothetical protein
VIILENKPSFNIIVPILLCLSLFGLYWLSRLQVEAGQAYLWLFVIGVIFIIVAVIAKLAKIEFWFELPFDKTSERAVLMLMFGTIITFVLFLSSFIFKYQFFSVFSIAPLASFGASIGAQTFAALQASSSSFWTFFIVVICAPVIEELVLGVGFVTFGSLVLGYGLRKLLKLDFGDGNKHWDFAMAMVFSMIAFAVLHFFNKSYLNVDGSWNLQLFGFAAVFRLILNILVYKLGSFGYLFGVGVHAVYNGILTGFDIFVGAILSFPGGIIIALLFILFIVFFVSSFKTMWAEGELAAKEFLTWD